MNGWPPQPGLTSCRGRCRRRRRARRRRRRGAGVDREPGAGSPASRIAFRVRLACGVGLGVDRDRVGAGLGELVDLVARAARSSGGRRSRRRRRGPGRRSTPATSGPIVIGGTKWPSITSTWISRAPASMHLVDLVAEAREVGREDRGRDPRGRETPRCDRRQLRPASASSGRNAGRACPRRRHADDRLVLAAVRALRDELVAAQAVDAAVAARELGRAQPRLAAARAVRARPIALRARRSAISPRAAVAGDEESGGRGRDRAQLEEAGVAARGELRMLGAEVVGLDAGRIGARAAATASFSRAEIVHVE